MSKENFETKLPVLEAMPHDEVRIPDIPVDVYLQEAENLSVIAEEDKKRPGWRRPGLEGVRRRPARKGGSAAICPVAVDKEPLHPGRSPQGMEPEISGSLRRA